MYIPARFAQDEPELMHALIADHPLGALVTHDGNGLDADHLPFELARDGAGRLVLRAHVARANPLWRREGERVMVLFRGASGYVTPSSRPRKAVDGRVVPTWNYKVVHVFGTLRKVDDPAWLLAQLGRQTHRHEWTQATPWAVEDAPPDYIDALLKAIVGIEIPIERLEGKWKVS